MSLLCWNHEPGRIDMEAKHEEGDVILRQRHQ